MIKQLLILSICASALSAEAIVRYDAVSARNSHPFFEKYNINLPKKWEIKSYSDAGELSFLSPKHSCSIHIMYSQKPKNFSARMQKNFANDYYAGIKSIYGQKNRDGHDMLKIAEPKPFTMRDFSGYSFDYVGFYGDGSYLSGISYLLFGDKSNEMLSVDISSANYKTRDLCFKDAGKSLKTLSLVKP